MVVAPKFFKTSDRVVAACIAVVCFTTGIYAFMLAASRDHLVLGVLAVLIIGLGAVFVGAAWCGKPWNLSTQPSDNRHK